MILKLCNLFHKFPNIPENSDVTSRAFGCRRETFMKDTKIQTNTEILPYYPNLSGGSNHYPRIATNGKNLLDIFLSWGYIIDGTDSIIISHIDP